MARTESFALCKPPPTLHPPGCWIPPEDLTWLLAPDTHVLGVRAFNDGDKAGVIAGLRVESAEG